MSVVVVVSVVGGGDAGKDRSCLMVEALSMMNGAVVGGDGRVVAVRVGYGREDHVCGLTLSCLK